MHPLPRGGASPGAENSASVKTSPAVEKALMLESPDEVNIKSYHVEHGDGTTGLMSRRVVLATLL